MLLLIQVVLILQAAIQIARQGIVTATNGTKKGSLASFFIKKQNYKFMRQYTESSHRMLKQK